MPFLTADLRWLHFRPGTSAVAVELATFQVANVTPPETAWVECTPADSTVTSAGL